MSSQTSCDASGSVADHAALLACMQNFGSSLQRIEGHYAAMQDQQSAILGRVSRVESQFAPLLQMQQNMDGRLTELAVRVTAVEQSHVSPHRGTVSVGALPPSARSFARASSAGSWMCPICRSGILLSALSLKGHIRRMLPDLSSSSRPKCRWKDSDQQQQALVARFEGTSFEDRCDAFTRTFYAFLQAATSSSYSDTECSELITSWLTAVLNGVLPLPVLPHCSSSSGSRRRLSSDTPSSST
jgi:hypothetical protein